MPATPKQHSAIISSWSAIFYASAEWQKQFVDELVGGAYMFIGESKRSAEHTDKL
jgi:hypothetical protein